MREIWVQCLEALFFLKRGTKNGADKRGIKTLPALKGKSSGSGVQ